MVLQSTVSSTNAIEFDFRIPERDFAVQDYIPTNETDPQLANSVL